MPGGNPMIDRITKQIEKERYAGFGTPQAQQPYNYGPPQPANPQAAAGGGAAQDSAVHDRLEQMYHQPSAGPLDTDRVTFDDVVMKTLALFAVLVGVGGVSWWLSATAAPRSPLPMALWMGGMFGGLAVGLAIAFMKKVSVPLIVIYAALEGAFLGAFSQFVELRYPGIVVTAVVATLCTFGGMFFGVKSGLIKVTGKFRRFFAMAVLGYCLFSLVQVVALMAGWTKGWGFGGSGMLGIGISLLGVGLAAASLAVDIDDIEQSINAGAPRKYSWLLAHGLIVSLVWLYIEIVRLLARLRD